MILKEGVPISADRLIETETLTGFEIINEKIDPLSSKDSILEETSVLNVKHSSCQASWFEKFKMRLFDSAIQFRNGRFSEASSSSSVERTEDEEIVPGVQTPAKRLFNPFATGKDDSMPAPMKKKKKKLGSSCVPLRRRLDFDAGDTTECDGIECFGGGEERLIESVSDSLIELIVSAQLEEEILAKASAICSEGCRTPKSLPLLSTIAETCPPAPMRPALFLERGCPKFRRKLDFGSNSD